MAGEAAAHDDLGVTIGRLGAADRAAVLAVDAAASRAPWTPQILDAELSAPGRTYLAAWVDGHVVGFAGLADLAGAGHVMALAVTPAMQRRGIGRRLLEALLTEAEHAGLDGVTLEVRASDARTRRLYRRAGFVEEGVRPGYYPDGEDAVIAWRR